MGLSGTAQITLPNISAAQRALVIGIALLVLFVVLFVREAYTQGWTWTGFIPSSGSTTDMHKAKGTDHDVPSPKTLWDWLQLLIVPLVLAFAAFGLNMEQQIRADQASTAQHQSDLAISQDQARETLLSTYIDHMSDLLLNRQYPRGPIQWGDETRTVAQARTSEVLPRLDTVRKGLLMRFLDAAHLITGTITQQPIISLSTIALTGIYLKGADLKGANLEGADLKGANLEGADLSGANLEGADLSGADLYGITLTKANLEDAYLPRTTLPLAHMDGANLIRASLVGADMRGVDMRGAHLAAAHLSGADLLSADLRGAELTGANLEGADLNSADLSGAILEVTDLNGANLIRVKGITDAQLEKVPAENWLTGTILPSGKRHK